MWHLVWKWICNWKGPPITGNKVKSKLNCFAYFVILYIVYSSLVEATQIMPPWMQVPLFRLLPFVVNTVDAPFEWHPSQPWRQTAPWPPSPTKLCDSKKYCSTANAQSDANSASRTVALRRTCAESTYGETCGAGFCDPGTRTATPFPRDEWPR